MRYAIANLLIKFHGGPATLTEGPSAQHLSFSDGVADTNCSIDFSGVLDSHPNPKP